METPERSAAAELVALLREFEQLPVRRLTSSTAVLERSPLDAWRARCGQAVLRANEASTDAKHRFDFDEYTCMYCGRDRDDPVHEHV